MKALLLRLCAFTLPIVAFACIEPLLPATAFTFRCWEAVRIYHRASDVLGKARMAPRTALPGPFLPGAHIERDEVGDLGHHTPYAVRRRASWVTDDYGYRTSRAHDSLDVVLIGDSHIVGSGLTQSETLTESLDREHGVRAYPYAPATVGEFLQERRFLAKPPTHVVLGCAEWRLPLELSEVHAARPSPELIADPRIRAVEFGASRVMRHNMLSFLRARARARPPVIVHGGLLFFQGAVANEEVGADSIAAVVRTLTHWRDEVTARGMRFAVMVVPNKENIYADVIPGARRATLIPRLAMELRRSGVDLIDLEDDLAAARAGGLVPFQIDDSHMSAAGTRLLSRRVAEWVRAEPR